ncbi:MAG: hypothetical protein JSV03_01290 [Planctomycetota bacterium]|nr:MAG: hypothetical protein JSV03_01290 [Planctomycetota bacterium]
MINKVLCLHIFICLTCAASFARSATGQEQAAFVPATYSSAIINDSLKKNEQQKSMAVSTNTAAVKVAGSEREDVPDWWKKCRAFYCPFDNSGAGASLMQFQTGGSIPDDLKDFRDLPKLLDDARKLGTNVIYLVGYWQPGYEYKGEYIPYEQCGGERAFRDGIAALKNQGGRIILYLEAFIISRKTEFGRRVGPSWAMMDEKGNFYSYYDTGDRFYLMYPGEGSGWTDHIISVAAEFARKYKIDGVHLDSYGLQWNWRDYNPQHSNGKDPNSFNRGTIKLVKRMRAEMRKYNPEAVVILEGAEHTELLDVCDGAQIESLAVLKKKPWWFQGKYPIYTSGFELAEMKAILDEGYQLALSPWWLKSHPGKRDQGILAEKTNKRNRFDQIRALNRYNNILVANDIKGLPPGASERISKSIISQLNQLKWKGDFTNPTLNAAILKVRILYRKHKDQLTRTPADRLKEWLQRAPRHNVLHE